MSDTRRTIDREELLAQLTWVRALARSLVADPGVAEDLAQEAWLAATTRPPRSADGGSLGGRELRSWLSAVVANLARKSVRTRLRRAAREERVARPEGGEDPSEVVARAALRTELASRVLALDEPYRSAILLRYFDGLPSQEISARLGISDEAARKRVSRGLALLRDDLDRAHGERSSWLALFALDGGFGSPSATSTATTTSFVTTSSATGLLLVMKILGAFAVIALAVLGLEEWYSDDAPLRTGVSTAALEGSTSSAFDATADALATDTTAVSERSLVPGGIRRTIHVRDEAGVRLADVVVLALDEGEVVARAQTSSDGSARIEGADDIDEFLLVAPDRRFAVAPVDAIETHVELASGGVVAGRFEGAGPERPDFVLELVSDRLDERFDGLHPSVLGALAELGLEGARRRVRVDANGLFLTAGLPADWSGRLMLPRAWHFAFVGPAGELVDPGALHLLEARNDLELAVEPPTHVRGRVVDAASATPLAGVSVRAGRADDRTHIHDLVVAESDADGRFELVVAARAAAEVELDAWAFGGRVRGSLTVVPQSTHSGEGVVFPLDVGRRIAIEVVDENGAALAGATARLPERVGTSPTEPSGPDGRLVIEGVAAADEWLSVDALGFENLRLAVPAADEVTAVMAAAATVRFVWLPEEGVPVAARRLSLTEVADFEGGAAQHFDRNGELVLGPLPRERELFAHLVDLLGGCGATVRIAPAGAAGERRIEMIASVPTVRVCGTVVDEGGRPLPQVAIDIEGAGAAFQTRTDADGRFALPAAFATGASARLEANRAGRVPVVIDEFVLAAGLAPFHLVLERGRRVEVQVLDHEGRPFDVGLVMARLEDDSADVANVVGPGVHAFEGLKERRGVVYTTLGGREISVPVEPHDTRLELLLPPLGRLSAQLPLADDASGVRTCLVIEPQGGGELMRIYVPLDHPRDQPFEVDVPIGSYRVGAERRTLGTRRVEALGDTREIAIAAGATVDVTWP